MVFVNILFILWIVIAFSTSCTDIHNASSAIQQAAGAAMGAFYMIFPYIILRIFVSSAQVEQGKEMIKLLRENQKNNDEQQPNP